jgi:hypothetical protein
LLQAAAHELTPASPAVPLELEPLVDAELAPPVVTVELEPPPAAELETLAAVVLVLLAAVALVELPPAPAPTCVTAWLEHAAMTTTTSASRQCLAKEVLPAAPL